jgi:serine phosphatase RsbU (regulator of sigma subunit)
MKGLLLALLLLLPAFVCAQAKNRKMDVDSLHRALNMAGNDSIRVEILTQLANQYEFSNIAKAVEYQKKAYDLSYSDESKAYSAVTLGFYYQSQHDAVNSMHYYLIAEPIYQKLKDDESLAVVKFSIGNVYFMREEFDKALLYFKESLKMRNAIGMKRGVTGVMINMAACYQKMNDLSGARTMYLEAISKMDSIKETRNLASAWLNLGTVERQLNNYENALAAYERSIVISKQYNITSVLSTCYENIAALHSYRNEDSLAIYYIEKSFDLIAKNRNLEKLANAYWFAAKISHKIPDHERAYSYFILHDSIRNLINTQKKDASLNEMLTKYETEKKQKQIEFLAKEKALQNALVEKQQSTIALQEQEKLLKEKELSFTKSESELRAQQLEQEKKAKEKERRAYAAEKAEQEEKIRNQNLIRNFILTGALFLLVLVVLVLRSLQQSRRAKNLIEQQKAEVEKQKELVEIQKESIAEKNKEILDSISYAQGLQRAILPTPENIQEHLPQSFVFYRPKDIVAGDFYFFESKAEKYWIAAADCTGHGVPGAMVSVVCSNALTRSLREFKAEIPAEMLDQTALQVEETFSKSGTTVRDGMDISLCMVDRMAHKLFWAGANNSLVLVRKDGTLEEIKADKQPIGKYENRKPFTPREVQLQEGDMVYLFTDGITDQFGGREGKKFRFARLRDLLISIHHLPAKEQLQAIEHSFDAWKGDLEQIDDVCLLGFSPLG